MSNSKKPVPTADDYWADSRTLKNSRHELFAYWIVQGKSQAEAYRRAFHGDEEEGSPHSARMGSALMKRPEVAYRIAQLQKMAASRVVDTISISESYVVDGYKELLERCMQREPVLDRHGQETGEWKFDASGAAKALEMMSKYLGLYKERKTVGEVEGKSDAELKRSITSLLGALNGVGGAGEAPSGVEPEEAESLRALPEAN